MHHVFAVSKLVDGSRKWSSAGLALEVRVEVSFPLPRVPQSIDGKLSRTSHEFPCLLVVSVGHGRPVAQSAAAVTLTVRSVPIDAHTEAQEQSRDK